MPCPFTGSKMFWTGPFFFVPDQKSIYILWQPQIFCAGQEDDLHSVKLVFCAGTKVFKDGLNAVKVFGLAKKIWTGTKHFGTCKRTRHNSKENIHNK